MTVCFLLVLMTAFVFSGCNNGGEVTKSEKKEEKPTIIGKWNATVDITSSLNYTLELTNAQMPDYLKIDKVTTDVTFTFNEDGTYSATLNKKDGLQKKIAEIEKAVPNALHEYLEFVIKAHGLNTTPEQMCVEQDDMTFEEEAADFVKRWNLSRYLEEGSGVYKLDGNTLFLGNKTNIIEDKFYTIDLKIDTLKATYFSKGTDELYKIDDMLPLEFKKVK